MLGRFIAGFAAIIIIVVIPLKYKGVKMAARMESAVCFAVDSAYAEIKQEGIVTAQIIDRLRYRISLSGVPYDIKIMIGTVITGSEELVLNISYTKEISEQIYQPDTGINVRGKLVSIKAIPLREGTTVKIANIFWDSFIPADEICCGGFIYG